MHNERATVKPLESEFRNASSILVHVNWAHHPDSKQKITSSFYRFCCPIGGQPKASIQIITVWKIGILIVQPAVRHGSSQALRIDTSKKVPVATTNRTIPQAPPSEERNTGLKVFFFSIWNERSLGPRFRNVKHSKCCASTSTQLCVIWYCKKIIKCGPHSIMEIDSLCRQSTGDNVTLHESNIAEKSMTCTFSSPSPYLRWVLFYAY